MQKLTMQDVEAAHSLKPYLPKKRYVKFFGFINYKMKKGWSGEKIMKLIELCLESNNTVEFKQPTRKEDNNNGRH
jgi:hypothetical protein